MLDDEKLKQEKLEHDQNEFDPKVVGVIASHLEKFVEFKCKEESDSVIERNAFCGEKLREKFWETRKQFVVKAAEKADDAEEMREVVRRISLYRTLNENYF